MTSKRIKVAALNVMTVDENVEPLATKGAIVRVKPTDKATPEALKLKVERVREHALAVKVMPRPAVSRVVLPQGTTAEQMPKETRAFIIEVLNTSSSQRKPELLEYINELADKQGI